ncbi:flagellar basal body rod protein FlgB [Pseudomarimonas arenosa]|uniref:Flagellar basal body rod protein FlgB n=1 Tax=Pseudomarimonas arenosa TaxID=2774145 RepID=A0AAW3ZF37_9GAMM|nr:flagellar basal body rod protein FlgB [Pseudomarimonas arenosa]MBD8524763.1 flagellar basal body rod protein FlgB [Pseudomarimonas arenosa]
MNDLSNAIFGLHGQALALRQQKMELIASNIANQDTPGYKAQDLDFVQALSEVQRQQAIAKQAAAPSDRPMGFPGLELGPTAGQRAADPAPLSIEEIGRQAHFIRDELQPSLDGNTVDSQLEYAAFSKAALEYRVTLNLFEGRARGLMLAITGQ